MIVRVIFSLAAKFDGPPQQKYGENAFLSGDFEEKVYLDEMILQRTKYLKCTD